MAVILNFGLSQVDVEISYGEVEMSITDNIGSFLRYLSVKEVLSRSTFADFVMKGRVPIFLSQCMSRLWSDIHLPTGFDASNGANIIDLKMPF